MPFRVHQDDELEDKIDIEDFLLPNKDAGFILKVGSNSSMASQGILPNDLLLVERGGVPRQGDIVLIYEDGCHKMRYFPLDKVGSKRFEGVKIEAVVTGLIRSYKR